MKIDSLVSVILPVYKAIESVLKQTFTNFELIVLDDGSTDNSLHIIEFFNDHRIHIIKNPSNLGLIKTLNKGLSIAKGKYLARMDADEICLPTKLEKQVNYKNSHPKIDILGTDKKNIDVSNSRPGVYF